MLKGFAVAAAAIAIAATVAAIAEFRQIQALVRQEWGEEHRPRPVEPSLAYMQDAASLFELGRQVEAELREQS